MSVPGFDEKNRERDFMRKQLEKIMDKFNGFTVRMRKGV